MLGCIRGWKKIPYVSLTNTAYGGENSSILVPEMFDEKTFARFWQIFGP